MDTFPDWSRTVPFQPSPYRTQFGAQAKVLLNLNGDNFTDLIVSQLGNFPAQTAGCLHIFLGGNPMDTLADQILNAPPPTESADVRANWGSQLISLNDLNGDSRTDFWVGGGTLLRFYRGGFPIDSMPTTILDQVGNRPAPGGDFNQDGFTDLILGQPIPSFLTGNVFIYLGSSQMNGGYDIAIRESDLGTVAQNFGLAVTNTGDMNGDGVDDFAASAKISVDPFDYGEVFIFSGDSSIPTRVKDGKLNLPRFFALSQNFPNPFNSSTIISYTLFRKSRVRLEIFNIVGNVVKVLVDAEESAGSHKVQWDGRDSIGKMLPSGIYVYRFMARNQGETKKMMLIR